MGDILSKITSPKETSEAETLPAMSTVPSTSTPNKVLDPRSPNMYRTPISDLPTKHSKQISKVQDLTNDDNISTSITTTPTKLKTKLLRELGYTLDPRSPAFNFDRTPLNFNDPNITDDLSFASLPQYDSDLNTPIKESIADNSATSETFLTPGFNNIKLKNAEIDPRSPSIEIERTPLNLNVIKEQVEEVINSQLNIIHDAVQMPITPKPDSIMTPVSVPNEIYMDEQQSHLITPNQISNKIEKSERQRTPLSCLVNTQNAENRYGGRERIKNKNNLARTVLKDSMLSANQNAKKPNSASKIPIFQKSNSN